MTADSDTHVRVAVRESPEWQRRVVYRLTRDCVSIESVAVEQQTDASSACARPPADPHVEELAGDDRVTVDRDDVVVHLGDVPAGEYDIEVVASARGQSVTVSETVAVE